MTPNLQTIRALIEARSFHAALAALDASARADSPAVEAMELRAGALAGLGRFREAIAECGRIAGTAELAPAVRARAIVRGQRLRGKTSLDTTGILCELGRALHLIGAGGIASEWSGAAGRRDPETVEVSGLAHLEAARVYARRRAKSLALEAIGRAREALGDTVDVFAAIGEVALLLDGRLQARDAYEMARARGAERVARLGLARVALVLGDYPACAELLDSSFAWGADLEQRGLRVELLVGEQRWLDVATVLGEMLTLSPQADAALTYEHERALAFYRAGARAASETALRAIVDGPYDPRDPRVAEARRTLSIMEARGSTVPLPPAGFHADPPREARRLGVWPASARGRTHCGPAWFELYMRFLGHDAPPVDRAHEPAAAHERPGGGGVASLFQGMRLSLERAGLLVLRVEADLPHICTLIDAGLPVLVQEPHSQSGQAALAMGYDHGRETLAVQDPLTHAVREVPYPLLQEIFDSAQCGALVAVAQRDSARLDAIDRAQITEGRHLVLTDRAFAALDESPPDLDAAEQLARRAIEVRRDHEPAWRCRFLGAMRRLAAAPTPEHRVAVHRIVDEIMAIWPSDEWVRVVVWPDDDWARGLAGRLLLVEDRLDDARAAYERACDTDRWDPANWFGLAQCAFRLGDYDRARFAIARALELDPSYQDANELGAYLAVLAEDTAAATVLNDCALAAAPQTARNHLVRGDIRAQRGDCDGALESYKRAYELDAELAASTRRS